MMLYGTNLDLVVEATGSPAPAYQWQWNGSPIAGATSATYTANNPGIYSVQVWNSAGSVMSSGASLRFGNRLAALSCRAFVGTDANVEIAGFVVTGPAGSTKSVLIRGAGPALTPLGVAGALTQPVLTLFDGAGKLVVTNSGWSSAANAAQIASTTSGVGEFAFAAGSGDSALLVNLTPGAYTAQIAGADRSSGIGLIEVYEAESGDAQLTAISIRAFVGTGASVQIAGISIGGTLPSKVLVRAIGPALAQYGVSGFLAQPTLSVIDGNGNVIATDTGWSNNANATAIADATSAVGDFALPKNSGDSALLLTLSPGGYTIIISGANGSTGVALAEIYQSAVNLEPQITTQPANQVVTLGQPATFSVTATGTAPFTYQWSRNGTPIPGATASTYSIAATGAADSGAVYIAAVTNSAGATTSRSVTLTVASSTQVLAPQVTAQPVGQAVAVGQTATFSVTATGTEPFTYQWNRGGAPISGATARTYTTPPTVLNDNSAGFTVTISNAGGFVTSTSAVLSVSAGASAVAPQITNQPQNVTVSSGQAASFVVAANGTAPVSYQWSRGGQPIPGATANVYTLAAAGSSDDGASFSVTVSNLVGSVTSQPVTLTVRSMPTITSPPAAQAVAVGQSATFAVLATGTAPLAYQWLRDGVWISGAIAATYIVPTPSLSDNGVKYSVIVSNAVGSVSSPAATLTVSGAPQTTRPQITSQPVAQTVSVGQAATFSATASGTAPLSSQWYRNGTPITGATGLNFTTSPAISSDTGAQFTVVVSNSAGSATSQAAALTVSTPPPAATAPQIVTPPASLTVNAGQSATFSVTTTGTAPLAYQWSRSSSPISTATNSSYTLNAASLSDSGAQFSVTITNAAGTVTSSAATLTVNAVQVAIAPQITVQPVSQTANVGQTATFSITASGSPAPSYQWQRGGVAISGATAASYTTSTAVSGDSGTVYTVVAANTAGSVTSQPATLTVVTAPQITTQPVAQTVTVGQSATFSVTASGTGPLGYQWQKNGTAINGASASSYTTGALTVSDSASTFAVVVANSAGSVTSQAAALTVIALPQVTTQPLAQTVNVGQSVTFTVAATGTGPLSYQWQKNGASISGGTGTSYTTPALAVGDNAAAFRVVVTNAGGSTTSSAATVTVNDPVASVTIAAIPLVRYGTSAQLSAVARDAQGNAVAGKTIAWNSSDPSIATVTSNGMASGARTGFTNITASVDGISGTAPISVMGPVVIPTRSSYVGTNLSGIAYWTTQYPFADLVKNGGGWWSRYEDGTWGGSFPATTADGYPSALNPQQHAFMAVAWVGKFDAGNYTVLWDGDGDISFPLSNVSLVSYNTGRAVLNVTDLNTGLWVAIDRTNAANPIHNVRFLIPGAESTYQTQPFNPTFLAKTAPFSCIRFMDWSAANGTPVVEWADRSHVGDLNYANGNGVPLEVMIDLANSLHTNAWFCVPYMASNDYITKFANLVHSRLDPGLKAYIEYSNEVWNWGFPQCGWCVTQSDALGLDRPWGTPSLFYAKRATDIFKIFQGVYGSEMSARVVRVIGGQAGWTQFQSFALGYADTAANTDALAIAPYFGAGGDTTWTTDQLLAAMRANIEGDVASWMDANAALAGQYRVKMIGYESGYGDSSSYFNGSDQDTMLDHYRTANYDHRMHDVYMEYWAQWAAKGGYLMNQYNDIGGWSKWGLWGALEYVTQPASASPKYQALLDFIAAHPTPP